MVKNRCRVFRALWSVAFGGPDRKTLCATPRKTLYHFPVNVSGHAAYPPLGRK